MDVALIALYIIVNIIIMIVFYRRDLGVFQAPFLVACIGLTLMLPQLTTIYFNPYYDSALVYKISYVMTTCNVAFAIGFNIGKKKSAPTTIRTFDFSKMQYLTFFFALIGFSTVFIYGGGMSGSVDGVIAANIKIFAFIGMSLSFVTLISGYKTPIVYISLALSLIPIINYAFFIKGSRTDSLILFMNTFLYLSMIFPSKRKSIKGIVLSFLLLGSVLSASITELRHFIKGVDEGGGGEVSFWETFKKSFTENETELGMDLGNAALGIEYCYENSTYDYGLQLWNGLVFNYLPKRLVGENTKANLYYDTGYQDIIPQLTNNVTTMTGYFYAFAAFSFYGFLFFGLIGYGVGVIWSMAAYSSLYRFLYFFVFTMVPAMVSHGIQLFFSNLEFFFIFLYPIISFFVIKMKLSTVNR
jgi:hypothetical protein